MLAKVPHPLAASGVATHQIVTAVNDQHVTSATDLATRLGETLRAPGAFKLTVLAAAGPAQEITVKR